MNGSVDSGKNATVRSISTQQNAAFSNAGDFLNACFHSIC